MKRLILFKGGVETLEFFTEQMATVWEKMGYSVFWYNLILQQASSSALVEFFKAHRADEWYMFTFNFEGIAGEAGLYRDDGWNFWDWADVKVVNVVVDHPLYYNKYIRKHPEKYIQLDIDEMHVAYMHRFFPEVHTEYMLTAGTELNYNRCILPDKNYLSMQERPIDIIFTGNYTPKRILRKHLDNMDAEYIDFYEGVLSYLIDNPSETIDAAAENALRREDEIRAVLSYSLIGNSIKGKIRSRQRVSLKTIARIAACIAIILSINILYFHSPRDICVTYIYGKKYTDTETVIEQMKHTVSQFDPTNITVEKELSSIFRPLENLQ